MSGIGWHLGQFAALDTETTGVDLENDRIVTACFVMLDGLRKAEPVIWSKLVDPQIPIPEAAAAVHGISTEKARADGEPPAPVIDALVGTVALTMRQGTPVVTMNGVFDLTLLDRECRRHQLPTIDDRLDGQSWLVIDIRVLDKHIDPYRRGSHKLVDLCKQYDVTNNDAHDSTHDAIAAARVAWRIASQNPQIAATPLEQLHEQQVGWAREQAESFRTSLLKQGKNADDVRPEWPVVPPPGSERAA